MDLKRKDNKMILRKWNNKEHKYEPYEIPDNWNCKTYSIDMKEIINCLIVVESLNLVIAIHH